MVDKLMGFLNSRTDQLAANMAEDKCVALKRKDLDRNIIGLEKTLSALKEK